MIVKRLPMASSPPLEKNFGMSCWQLTDYLNIRMFRIQGWLGCRKRANSFGLHTRTTSLAVVRPLPPGADIGREGSPLVKAAHFCLAAPTLAAGGARSARPSSCSMTRMSSGSISISILRRRPPRLSATTGHRSSGALAT